MKAAVVKTCALSAGKFANICLGPSSEVRALGREGVSLSPQYIHLKEIQDPFLAHKGSVFKLKAPNGGSACLCTRCCLATIESQLEARHPFFSENWNIFIFKAPRTAGNGEQRFIGSCNEDIKRSATGELVCLTLKGTAPVMLINTIISKATGTIWLTWSALLILNCITATYFPETQLKPEQMKMSC